jgi:hypothetical protein
MNIKTTLSILIFALSTSFAFSQNLYKIPSQNKHLAINLEGFKIERAIYSKDSSAFQLSAFNKKSGTTLSIFIEKAEQEGDKLACRDFYWSKAEKSPLAKENLKTYQTENAAIVEHDTKEFNGMKVNYHSLNAYLASGNYWVDVHVSKMGYEEKDKDGFEKLVKSAELR